MHMITKFDVYSSVGAVVVRRILSVDFDVEISWNELPLQISIVRTMSAYDGF